MLHKNNQRGIALFMSLVVLLLLSALAVAFVYMANTDTQVNANYRNQQVLYFAAKAGMEEARDRLMVSNVINGVGSTVMEPTCAPASACLPAVAQEPTGTNRQILYILGGSNPAAITPWTVGSAYFDDELCHDSYTQIIAEVRTDTHCTNALPAGAWYSATTSKIPWNSTGAAIPFQWVRISPKLNGSVDSGKYKVVPGAANNIRVCWDGTKEILLSGGAADCTQMVNLPVPGPAANPVYLITALAANPVSGSRRMVQAEVALDPQPPFPYGLFATGTGCSAMKLAGGSSTDSFTSAGGQTWDTSHQNTGGDIGSNGNVNLGGSSTNIGGDIGVPNNTTGPCPAGLTTTGNPSYLNLQAAGPYTFLPPPPPNPMPPTTDLNLTKKGGNLTPGSYGNITQNAGGKLTLAPGTYTINSLVLLGNATLEISPDGAIVINIGGKAPSGADLANPVDLSGGSISNLSHIANNFLINYAGTGTIKFAGGTDTYITVYAPNANVQITGGTDLYGSVIGATIDGQGKTKYHYDKNSKLGPPSNGNYEEIAFREIAY